jgi:iron complex outermembrane receptor protein
MYIFLRHNPNYYRNLHINNKVGLSFNSTFPTKLGTTGVGLDINQGFLVSNNLNNHNRFTTTFFIDQHSLFFKKKVSIKKGVALSYYSDLGFFAYPGLDISYQFSKSIKLIANIGYTFRNPTYTNLYYHSYTEEGNVELKPEKAFNYEFGLDYSKKNSSISLSYFNRTSKDFIDYVKNSEEEKWKANNIGEINTHGIETNYVYKYSMYNFRQKLDISYAFVNQEYKNGLYTFSRYSLNAFKHQFKTTFSTQFFSFLKQSIYYSYNERFQNPGYHLLDLALTTQLEKWEINVKANNIFSTDYYETNLVPMPKVNYSMQIKYRF